MRWCASAVPCCGAAYMRIATQYHLNVLQHQFPARSSGFSLAAEPMPYLSTLVERSFFWEFGCDKKARLEKDNILPACGSASAHSENTWKNNGAVGQRQSWTISLLSAASFHKDVMQIDLRIMQGTHTSWTPQKRLDWTCPTAAVPELALAAPERLTAVRLIRATSLSWMTTRQTMDLFSPALPTPPQT